METRRGSFDSAALNEIFLSDVSYFSEIYFLYSIRPGYLANTPGANGIFGR